MLLDYERVLCCRACIQGSCQNACHPFPMKSWLTVHCDHDVAPESTESKLDLVGGPCGIHALRLLLTHAFELRGIQNRVRTEHPLPKLSTLDSKRPVHTGKYSRVAPKLLLILEFQRDLT